MGEDVTACRATAYVAGDRANGYASGATPPRLARGARENSLLARLRGWFMFGALLVCVILFAGLVHDFGQPDPSTGWFTGRPTLALVLLGIGYVLMLLQRLGSRGQQ
jgi:hypothetical protein